MANHRSTPRYRTLLKGRVIFPNKQSTMDCVVRDLSEGGARLHIGHHDTVPDHFSLYVPLKETTYQVTVRWRQNEDVGVMFDTGEDEDEASQSLAGRVEALEAELRELRELVGHLQSRLGPHS
jgi:hypothetical protein